MKCELKKPHAQAGFFRIEEGPKGPLLTGPSEYMKERGNKKLSEIDTSESFKHFLQFSPNAYMATCVWLQTDYAAWKGEKELMRGLK